eukprot:9047842-Pyramimonas_sp.AAC.1
MGEPACTMVVRPFFISNACPSSSVTTRPVELVRRNWAVASSSNTSDTPRGRVESCHTVF